MTVTLADIMQLRKPCIKFEETAASWCHLLWFREAGVSKEEADSCFVAARIHRYIQIQGLCVCVICNGHELI